MKKTTSYWTFKFSLHAFIKPTSQKKNQPASGQRGLAVMMSAASLMKFSTQVNCFLKRQIGHGFIFIQHSRLCFLTFCVIITVETIGGILPVIFWLVPL